MVINISVITLRIKNYFTDKNICYCTTVFFATSIIFCNHINSQSFDCSIRLLSSSKQVKENNNNYFIISSIEIAGKEIHIRCANRRNLIASTDSIWGYQIKEDRTVVRSYSGGFYKVKKIDSLTLYSQKDYGSEFHDYIYSFSFGLDSAIHLINKTQVRKLFAKNECILNKLKSIKLWQYPTDWDSNHKTIRFWVWCKECNLINLK